jgi:hypothetical protein
MLCSCTASSFCSTTMPSASPSRCHLLRLLRQLCVVPSTLLLYASQLLSRPSLVVPHMLMHGSSPLSCMSNIDNTGACVRP